MKIPKMLFAGAALAGLLASTPVVRADNWNQATQVTFNKPIQIPGNRVLPAGTYWFKTQDRYEHPNVVVIYNGNRSHVEATLITRPTQRSLPAEQVKPLGKTQFTLVTQPNDQPDVLLKWFYPGRATGHEFLYSASRQKVLDRDRDVKVIAAPTQAS